MENKFQQFSDWEIIQQINSGEIRLYEILIRRYNSILYKIGRSYGFNHQDTEDLMEDAYVNAYTGLKNFENRSSFKTWLTRIMLNLCYHKKNKSSYKREIIGADIPKNESVMFHPPTNNENNTVNKELGQVLENAIHHIPEDYRIVFTLRELNGFSVAETASLLDISESNVKVRLSRSKAMLQKEIRKVYSPEEIFEFNLIYCDAIVERVMNRIDAPSQM